MEGGRGGYSEGVKILKDLGMSVVGEELLGRNQRLTDPASLLCELQDPPIGPRPPKPVAVPRGRRAPQVPGGREEPESGSATPGVSKPRLRLGSQQDPEEPEVQGLSPYLKGAWENPGVWGPPSDPLPKHRTGISDNQESKPG